MNEYSRFLEVQIVDRPWGYYEQLVKTDTYSVRLLSINPGEMTSYQKHSKRSEVWTLLEGEVVFEVDDHKFTKSSAEDRTCTVRVPAYTWHRLSCPVGSEKPALLLEIVYGVFEADDFVRKEDKYGRKRIVGPDFILRPIDKVEIEYEIQEIKYPEDLA